MRNVNSKSHLLHRNVETKYFRLTTHVAKRTRNETKRSGSVETKDFRYYNHCKADEKLKRENERL